MVKPLPSVVLDLPMGGSYSYFAARLQGYVQHGMLSDQLAGHALLVGDSAFAGLRVVPRMLSPHELDSLERVLSYEYTCSGLYDCLSPLLPALQLHYASADLVAQATASFPGQLWYPRVWLPQ